MVILLLVVFIVGYLLITLEHAIHINKAAIALITAVLCWTIIVMNPAYKNDALLALGHHLSSVAEIVFFLLGAMTIVELIDAHDGFQNITEKIKTTNKTKFVWTIALVTFFLSAVLYPIPALKKNLKTLPNRIVSILDKQHLKYPHFYRWQP